jgi:predicted nucleic acid-binding protein
LKPGALLDSDVVIAVVAEAHEHHAPSLALFTDHPAASFAIAAHSYAEAYSTLTRRGGHAPFRFNADEAWAALESLRTVSALVGLTAAQTFDTVRDYSRSGGVGARLYDRLIGEAAVAAGLPTVITWNTGHMRSLFPQLEVLTPQAFARADG